MNPDVQAVFSVVQIRLKAKPSSLDIFFLLFCTLCFWLSVVSPVVHLSFHMWLLKWKFGVGLSRHNFKMWKASSQVENQVVDCSESL